MAWVTPPTFTAATTATAADANILGDDLNYLKAISDGVVFSAVQLNRVSNQSLTSGTPTLITWTAEAFDIGGWWASGTTVTVPAGAVPTGYTTIAVVVFGRVKFASNSTGVRRVRVLLNGTAFGSRTYSALGGGDDTDVDISEVTVCAAGDTLTVEAYQTSGGALNATESNVTFLRQAPVA